ncbi:MmgE/PrpD family protein [Pseudonocardia lutea]|uniref:MmgE/PrpD family protein n=1 Tax=Pseudonocardia lutea TaxID=2172015 RepID=A0ABW1IGM0_9PSEU
MPYDHDQPATQAFAEFVADASLDDLPVAALEAAKVALLDGVGCLVAGSGEPAPTLARAALLEDASGPCTVVGSPVTAEPATAALLNGIALHSLDFEVQGTPPAHGTSSILPGVLALSERYGVAPNRAVLAFVVGWQVQQQVRTASSQSGFRGFHPPGVVGPLGATAACSIVLGLNADQIAGAFGLAASRAGGLFANNGTMAKPTHPGNSARTGVESALLAARGMYGNPRVLEMSGGHFETFYEEEPFRPDLLLAGLGEDYAIVSPGFTIKCYPAEIFMQWVIDACQQLRKDPRLDVSAIAEVVVEPPLFRAALSRPRPVSGLDGKFSYEYAAAVGLTQERVIIGSFHDDTAFSEPVQALLPKVRLQQNPDIPETLEGTWARVTVRLRDSTEIVVRCDRFRGCPERPMTRDEHRGKVLDCLTAGGLDDGASRRLVSDLEQLETLTSWEPVLSALRQAGGRTPAEVG